MSKECNTQRLPAIKKLGLMIKLRKTGVRRVSQLVIIMRHLATNMRTFTQHKVLSRTLPLYVNLKDELQPQDLSLNGQIKANNLKQKESNDPDVV